MGLSINYTVKLLGDHPLTDTRTVLEALRQHCLDLPFASVGELNELEENELSLMTNNSDGEQHPILGIFARTREKYNSH